MKEELSTALEVLRRSPGRSALTMLGLAIGVGAFIAMLSFGRGARRAVLDQFQAFGTHVLQINPRGNAAEPPQPLTDRDLEALRRDAPSIARVVPYAIAKPVVEAGGRRVSASVVGAGPEYLSFFGREVALGGGFDEQDMARREKICVLGATPAGELFPGEDPLGARVALGEGLACRVVGVVAAKGFSTAGRDQDDFVLIPLTTYRAYLGFEGGYARLTATPVTPDRLEAARDEANEVLRRTHGIGAGEADDFKVSSPAEAIAAADSISTILSNLLAAIAAVSLVVGGIGIMNIQLVAVTERTAEIGIRAAIGASPRQILRQFVLEAAVLSTVGTLVGVLLGVALSIGVARAMGWGQVLTAGAILGSTAFGIGAGLAFGYAPARRAADMDPIEALRRE